MRKKPTLLAANMAALAVATAALLLALLYTMQPTIGTVWTWVGLLAVPASDPMCWLLVGGMLTGMMGAALQKPGDIAGHGLAALCLVAGLGLGIDAWLPGEFVFSFTPGIIPEGYPPGHARILFMGINYVMALSYALLGLAGSAAVLAVIRLRGKPPGL